MLKSLKTQIMILVVHGFRQILLLKAGVRIKCMKLQHPVGKKCYHLKAVVGDILKMYTTNYFLRAGCGLGQTAPNPVLSTLKFFESEYLDKLADNKPASKEEK